MVFAFNNVNNVFNTNVIQNIFVIANKQVRLIIINCVNSYVSWGKVLISCT